MCAIRSWRVRLSVGKGKIPRGILVLPVERLPREFFRTALLLPTGEVGVTPLLRRGVGLFFFALPCGILLSSGPWEMYRDLWTLVKMERSVQ